MMFVDTSALVAIILDEPEADEFLNRLEAEKHRCTSPLVVLETTMVLSSHLKLDISGIRAMVGRVLRTADIEVISINARMGDFAVEAFGQYGKGRHPARLNLGDCMSYAVAKASRAPLLYKGDDFRQTDLG